MSIKVKEIAFLFHGVKKIPAARKFYEGLLGLKVLAEFEFSRGKWWIEYDIAGQALAISNAFGAQRPSSSLALEVADLDAAYATVRKKRTKITSEMAEYRPCRMFEIADPDGNKITLHQRKKR